MEEYRAASTAALQYKTASSEFIGLGAGPLVPRGSTNVFLVAAPWPPGHVLDIPFANAICSELDSRGNRNSTACQAQRKREDGESSRTPPLFVSEDQRKSPYLAEPTSPCQPVIQTLTSHAMVRPFPKKRVEVGGLGRLQVVRPGQTPSRQYPCMAWKRGIEGHGARGGERRRGRECKATL